ncbi:MAG: methionine--tRNA ligase [bacterium]
MEMKKRTLITSALPYANGYIHLGHLAGAYLPADIYARYLRLKGEYVLYICGSDEHGVAITIAADKEKVKPQDIIDKYHNVNKEAFDKFGMTFDNYSRTSIPEHHETAKEFFKDFLENDLLSEKEEEQFYDEKAKMFLPDRYVEGICPNCGSDKARGDQCDSCGAYYDQLELKNPISLVSGEKPVVNKTTHWYMRFDKFQKFLEEYIESHSHNWKDNVLQQTRSWLKQGLNERAITRDLDWGVKISDIPGILKDKADGKALYVWFEAVLGYISSTKEHFKKLNASPDEWKKWWKDEATRYIAFIGKDNIVFHTLIFPAMLHAKNNCHPELVEGYILPDNVPANEFLNLEGRKISKSRNWSIDLKDFIEDFPEVNYMDTLRYTLAMNLPETKDADFTWKDFQARNNNELSAIFGNFVNRTLQFLHKNFKGQVPQLPDKYIELKNQWVSFDIDKDIILNKDLLEENDYTILSALYDGIKKINKNYEVFRFRDALTETMNIARAANKYFNDEEPWKSGKNQPEKCAKTLYVCTQLVRSLAILFSPILPYSCKKINNMLDMEQNTGIATGGMSGKNTWNESALPLLPEGHQTILPELLFVRVEDKVVEEQTGKLGDVEEQKGEQQLITIDDFAKIKLRTAKIIEAEKVKKSKKLIKLIVDLGDEKRQILAGIAEYYEPEYLIGKIVVVVANLQPAKLMGLESHGMMLAASKDGKLCFLTPENEDVGAGAEVR